MKELPYKPSAIATIGAELEFQIIDPMTYSLISRAKELIRSIRESPYQKNIKPEITQSMIELNSSIHQSPTTMYAELLDLHSYLLKQAKKIGVKFCGGGTHPFHKWSSQKIFPVQRYKNLSSQYRYLSKRSTVFGLHIHIGCENGEDALYLTHALARYVPQFIAISASSPFYQGVDTKFNSTRSTVFNAFPLSGVIPYLLNWKDFSNYYYKMRKLKIISSMKDFYWDIRPKPEFGTVELRVCDVPLTIEKAIIIVAYLQSLSLYLLKEKPINPSHDLYDLYNYNRFQASRYGFSGEFIQPDLLKKITISNDILLTIDKITRYTKLLKNTKWISKLHKLILNEENDTTLLTRLYKKYDSLPKVVHDQCIIWETEKHKEISNGRK